MKKLAPLGVLLLLAIAGLTVWLSRAANRAPTGTSSDDLLAPAVAPAAPSESDAAAPAEATEPAAAETPATTETEPEAPATPALPDWIPADATDDAHGAIAATVLLAPDVPAMGASAALSGPESRQAFSDQLGHLLAARLAPGRYRLVVGFAGYATFVRDGIAVEAKRVTDLGVIDLGAGTGGAGGPIAEVTIEVTAKDGGKAIPGATVTLTTVRPYGLQLAFGTEGRPGELTISSVTGEDGRTRLQGLRPGTYDVLAIADGFALGVRPNLTVHRATRVRVPIELPAGVHLRGLVRKADGAPAAGAIVLGMNMNGFKSSPATTADADGRFDLGSLDPGSYFVLAFLDGHGSAQQSPVKVPGDGLELTLGKAFTLTGRIVSKADGLPVAAGTIRPYPGGQPFAYVYSIAYPFQGPDGLFELPLDPGVYSLEVTAPGFATTTVGGVKASAPQPGEAAPAEVLIALEPAGAVHGVVRAKGLGTPIVGAEVFLRMGGFPPSPHKAIYAVTGPEGTFRLEALPAAKLNLHVTHPEFSSAVIQGVSPSPGEGTGVEVELSGGGAVAGRVLDAAGQPIAGVDVHCMPGADFVNMRTVVSGPDGGFRFEPLTPGTWSLALGDVAGQQGTNFKAVEVREGEVTRVDLGGLRGAGQAVTGHVTRNGAAMADVTVQLWIEGRNAQGEDSGAMSATTAADGSFSIPDVAPGRYTAWVEVGGAVARVPVEVTGQAPPAPVSLELREAAIRGVVRDPDGKPLDGVWVTLERVAATGGMLQNYNGQAYTKPDGRFEITGLADATYRLRAFHLMGGFAAALVDDLRVNGGIGVEGIDIRLTTPRQVTGRVLTTNESPVEGANLRVLDSQGRDFALIGFSSTGSDGRYAINGLRADVYTIVAEAAGHAPASVTVNLSVAVSQAADFVLTPGATLRVVATDGEGKPVAGAAIELRDGAGNLVTKGVSLQNLLAGIPATDAQGVGFWKDLTPASYRVRLVPIGASPVEVAATAVAGQTVDVPIQVGG